MKVIFNCINNVVGGGVQNSANFISYALQDSAIEYMFFVSSEVLVVLNSWGINSDKIFVFENRKNYSSNQRKIKKLEANFSPDLAYTMAGPTYNLFKCTHVLGISNPYITHANWDMFSLNRSLFESIRLLIQVKVMGVFSRISAQRFVFQTEVSRQGFCSKFLVNKKFTSVVPNAIGTDFLNTKETYLAWNGCEIDGVKRVLCPSAYYNHKNIDLIFKVALLLIKKGREDLQFTITVPASDFECLCRRHVGAERLISNIGPFNYSDAPEIYKEADAILLPSLLETFSTVYIEAMALGKTLFVPNKDFALDICGEYAIYYKPACASALLSSLLSIEEQSDANLKERIRTTSLQKYGTQLDRYKSIASILTQIARY